jgi:transporter family protein
MPCPWLDGIVKMRTEATNMPAWLAFGLLSAASAALVAVFGKAGLRDVDANVATAIRAVVMVVFLAVVVAAEGKLGRVGQVLANRRAMTFIVLSGVAGATSWLFYFLALQHGKVSQVAPIDKLSVVFATIVAVAFLKERIGFTSGLGVALIAAGAILVALG